MCIHGFADQRAPGAVDGARECFPTFRDEPASWQSRAAIADSANTPAPNVTALDWGHLQVALRVKTFISDSK